MDHLKKEESTERQVANIFRELHDKATVVLNNEYDRDKVRDIADGFSRKYAKIRSLKD